MRSVPEPVGAASVRPDETTTRSRGAHVLNYVKAMNHGLQRLRELPLCVCLIREIHERLLTGVRGDRFQPREVRRTQNWIGPSGATLNEASFVPPPTDVVPQALSDWERFVRSDGVRAKGQSKKGRRVQPIRPPSVPTI